MFIKINLFEKIFFLNYEKFLLIYYILYIIVYIINV